MPLSKRFLVFFVLACTFLISGTACNGDGSGGDAVSPDPADGGNGNPDPPVTSDWGHPPSHIDAGTAAGNPHHNSGGRRIVRISGTTIAVVNHSSRDRLYRSTDDG